MSLRLQILMHLWPIPLTTSVINLVCPERASLVEMTGIEVDVFRALYIRLMSVNEIYFMLVSFLSVFLS